MPENLKYFLIVLAFPGVSSTFFYSIVDEYDRVSTNRNSWLDGIFRWMSAFGGCSGFYVRGFCYTFETRTGNHQQAVSWCQQRNASLPEITSPRQYAVIRSHVVTYMASARIAAVNFWIEGHYQNGHVILRSGAAPFVRWATGDYPRVNSAFYHRLQMLVRADPEDKLNGIVNTYPAATASLILCQD